MGPVARMRGMGTSYNILDGKPEGKRSYLEDLWKDGRIILKLIFEM
jgi:hypothetical protein